GNERLTEALRYSPDTPTEKHWQRILRAIIGEEAMHPRIEQAFENFLAELNEILAEAQETIKRKVDEGCFDEVARLSQEAQRVRDLIEQVRALRGRWAAQDTVPAPLRASTHSGRGTRRRASSHEITPESVYKVPLLRTLVEMGGKGKRSEVCQRIYDQLKHMLKPKDYEVLSSRSPRWQVKIEFLKADFVRMGYIRYAGTGIWEITDAGREYLKQLQAEEA
ncbi:MAG: winged helix-turn-helix domain-containing protein, partial [Fimbriimonadales bacterium]|nr:winged helix-turn-helix domain-containing protein [Fimbriimonadales bacterium]